MDNLTRFFEWIGANEAILSGIAASIVIAGVLFTPLGSGLRTLWRRGRDEPSVEAPPNPPQTDGGRPSIAVLPFSIPPDDSTLESLADGLVDDVINSLSRAVHFNVIARGSTFAYKGRSVDVREVSEDLGVRWVVEGSVRRLADGVRITAQLVNTQTRAPAWADRYDEVGDLSRAQDAAAARITAAIHPALRRAEAERVRRSPAQELDVWSLVNRAWVALQSELGSPEAAELAASDCQHALFVDPDDALAHAVLAHARSLTLTATASGPAGTGDALASARRAVAAGGHDPAVQHCYAAVLGNIGRTADSLRAWKRCLELDPNNAAARAGLGISLIYKHEAAEALQNIDRALWLSPRDPLLYHWLAHRALACAALGRFSEAAAAARESVERSGTQVGWGVLAVVEAELGHLPEAHEAWQQLMARQPDLDVDTFLHMVGNVITDEAIAERAAIAIRTAAGAIDTNSRGEQ